MISFWDLKFAIAFEAGFAASRGKEQYRDKFNEMTALDGANYAREAYALNAMLTRAKQNVETYEVINETKVL